MTQRGPLRSQQSYRHEALLWHTAEDFTDTLVPFVDEGLDAGEPVMVAVTPQHTAWLQEALGAAAAQEVHVRRHDGAGPEPGPHHPRLAGIRGRRVVRPPTGPRDR